MSDLRAEDSGEDVLEEESPESQLTRALMTELVKLRKKKKIGQEPIAKAIGITQGRVSQMENLKGGHMTMEAVLLYAKTIGAEIVVVSDKGKKRG